MASVKWAAQNEKPCSREFAEAGPVELCRRPPEKTAPFQFLHDLETDALLELIADEQPQTVALILSCVPPQQAAAVLAGLTIEDQISLVCRIATVGAASPEVVRDVENALMRRLCAPGGGSTENRGVASLVRILNSMSPPVERRLLASLSETAPQFVQEIRRAMFGVDVAAGEEQDARSAAGEVARTVGCHCWLAQQCGRRGWASQPWRTRRTATTSPLAFPLGPPLPPSPFRC